MHVRPRLIDAAVDEALEIRRPVARVDRIAFERELHDVVLLDALGRTRSRQQEALGIVGMARAHMPERVHDTLMREDAVGGDDLFEQGIEAGHGRFLGLAVISVSSPQGGDPYSAAFRLFETCATSLGHGVWVPAFAGTTER